MWLSADRMTVFPSFRAPKVKSPATHHSRRKQPAMLPSILHSKLWPLPPQALTAPTPTSDSFYPKFWLLPQFTAYSGIPCGAKCLSYFHLPLNFFKMDLSNSQQSHEWQPGSQTAWTLHCRMHCVWTYFYKTCILHFMFSSQIYLNDHRQEGKTAQTRGPGTDPSEHACWFHPSPSFRDDLLWLLATCILNSRAVWRTGACLRKKNVFILNKIT